MGEKSQAIQDAKIVRRLLSNIFREVRESSGLKQFEFAEALGMTVGTANRLELGKSRWNDEMIVRVASLLGSDLPSVFRALADSLEDRERTIDPAPADPLRAQLNDLYDRKDWTGLMRHLGTLAEAWEDDGR